MAKKILVLYDSSYGNTVRVGEAIAKAIGADSVQATKTGREKLLDYDMVFFGSPTQGGTSTPFLQDYMKNLPDDMFEGVKIAAFDTRYDIAKQKFWLRMLMRSIGYAAPKLQDALVAHGGTAVGEPEGFIVEGNEGPLRDGELERAAEWAQKLRAAANL